MNVKQIKKAKQELEATILEIRQKSKEIGVDIDSKGYKAEENRIRKEVLAKLGIKPGDYNHAEILDLIEEKSAGLEKKIGEVKERPIGWEEIKDKPVIEKPEKYNDSKIVSVIRRIAGRIKADKSEILGRIESGQEKIIYHRDLLGVGPDDHHKEKHTLESHIESEFMARLKKLLEGMTAKEKRRGEDIVKYLDLPIATAQQFDSSLYYTKDQILALLNTYIPYLGATADVDLGAHNLTVANYGAPMVFADGNISCNGASIDFYDQSFYDSNGKGAFEWGNRTLANNVSVSVLSWDTVVKIINIANSYGAILDASLITTPDKTFTFPDLSGTIALMGVSQTTDFTTTGTGTFTGGLIVNSDTVGLKLGADGDVSLYSSGAGIFNFKSEVADTDLTLNFLGTTKSGVLKWMEDEDYFQFADKAYFPESVGIGVAPSDTISLYANYSGTVKTRALFGGIVYSGTAQEAVGVYSQAYGVGTHTSARNIGGRFEGVDYKFDRASGTTSSYGGWFTNKERADVTKTYLAGVTHYFCAGYFGQTSAISDWTTNNPTVISYGIYLADKATGYGSNHTHYSIWDAGGGDWVMDSDASGVLLGAGQDAKIYYDGTDLQINPKVVGTGVVNLNGGGLTTTGTITAGSSPGVGIIGEIREWGGAIATVPTGWLFCNGAAISRTTYAALFAVLGTIHGSGDGSTTFNLPDKRDYMYFGAKEDVTGVPKSNVEGTLKQDGGTSNHTHQVSGSPSVSVDTGNASVSDEGHSHSITMGSVYLNAGDDIISSIPNGNYSNGSNFYENSTDTGYAGVSDSGHTHTGSSSFNVTSGTQSAYPKWKAAVYMIKY